MNEQQKQELFERTKEMYATKVISESPKRYKNWLTNDKVTLIKRGRKYVEYQKDEPNEVQMTNGDFRMISDFAKPIYVFDQIYSRINQHDYISNNEKT